MNVKEADKYYLKEFGDNPRYDMLFGEGTLFAGAGRKMYQRRLV